MQEIHTRRKRTRPNPSNLSKVWSITYQSPSLYTAFWSDRNQWIDRYVYTDRDTAKIFLPSLHGCKRTPSTSRLVPSRGGRRDQYMFLIITGWISNAWMFSWIRLWFSKSHEPECWDWRSCYFCQSHSLHVDINNEWFGSLTYLALNSWKIVLHTVISCSSLINKTYYTSYSHKILNLFMLSFLKVFWVGMGRKCSLLTISKHM